MAITAAQVKELRDITGISMMECKKALEETNGNIEESIDVLRKKGLSKAAKAADRQTSEGIIKVECEGNKCYIVSVQCETDFVAKTDVFQKMASEFLQVLKTEGNEETAKEKMEVMKTEYVMKMGENINIKDVKIISGGKVVPYLHSNEKLAAVVVSKETTTDDEKLKQVAMHVTATNPDVLSPADISEAVITKEKSIQLEIMKNDPKMAGKPEEVLLKIIEGKMDKFKSDISLLEQAFVINPDQKVKDFIGANTLESFYRFNI
ncbi:translation elongation factor Ts [Candidatus Gracilibacteria bacterium]|nr:translation elongation factor Ts [Candidatus Gracilibacteria bacterium]NUJ98322.1 translation elongation factor Ts [Candidatus Gracilibacteria bacterium]NUJ99323.1 translation elongation factor Ts [Candidatus Gracilibacteria bacterium]